MKEAKVYFLLDKRSTSKKGGHPLKIVAYYKGKQVMISLGIFFTPEEWDIIENRSIKKHHKFDSAKGSGDGHEVLSKVREEIDACLNKARNAVKYLEKRGLPFQAIDIKQEYEKEHRSDDELMYFHNCYYAYVDLHKAKGWSSNTASSYQSTYNVMKEYYQGLSKRNKIENLRFVQMDADFMREYERYLREDRNNSEGTIGISMRNIRALFNFAIDKGAVPKEVYPFGRGDEKIVIRNVVNTKRLLSKEELSALLEYRPKLLKNQVRNFDLAILSFLLHGANMKDIATLTYGKNYKENDNMIVFMREKTWRSKQNITPVHVIITDEIKHLMEMYGNEKKPENYIFNILNPKSTKTIDQQVKFVGRAINRTLKRVAKNCGVRSDICFQSFRHTHAQFSIMYANANEYEMMTSMGHASIETTRRYIRSLHDTENKIGKMKSGLMVGVFDEK